LLQGAVEVLASVVPGVAIVVFLDVRPGIGEEDSPVIAIIGKCIKDMRELVSGNLVRAVCSPVNALLEISNWVNLCWD
jgi:hypothetical protein